VLHGHLTKKMATDGVVLGLGNSLTTSSRVEGSSHYDRQRRTRVPGKQGALCFELRGCPSDMTKRKYIRVSRTWIGLVLSACTPADTSPPNKKIRVPSQAIA
jgi:hypothetical protein